MPNRSWLRQGSASSLILGIIIGIVFVFGILLFLVDEEENPAEESQIAESLDEESTDEDCEEDDHCSFFEEEESDWYDEAEDYDDDDDVWDSWETHKKSRAKKSRLHSKYGDGLFRSEAELRNYINQTATDINDVWSELFREYKKKYRKPKINIFTDDVKTGCGVASTEDGPFYCSEDETVYLDLNFFANMSEAVDASGKFAISYVIAHEYGHHIQNLIGDLDKYGDREERLRARGNEKKANLVAVQTELQADFYAGVWANRYDEKTDAITEDDIENALNAAIAVGDDALGENRRENFDHGSSEMRIRWLVRGMATGDVKYGNTYDYKSLRKLENADMMIDDEE